MAVEAAVKRLHIADYLIFAATIFISLGIGLYHALSAGRRQTSGEYFMGGRGLQTIPVALSILVSFISAIMVLGTPAEMYTQGTQMTLKTGGYCLALGLSSILFVPLFYGLKITSSFEYLERRYNSVAVKLMGSAMMIFGNLLYMGLVIYTPSTALEAVTGIPFWVSVLASAFVATIYTAIGGMRAVVWTDVFQALVMIGGMLAIVIQGTIKVGGLSKVWEISNRGGRLIWFDFNPDPTQRLSFWSLVIGGLFSGVGIFGIGQTSMQRYCALPTLPQAKRSLFLNIPGLIIVNILAGLVGLVIYAYYAQAGCDPLKQKYISNQNQLVPYFVLDVLNYPGFPGVFLAVLFSGALSSVSSVLNSLAAVTWQDILKPCCLNLSESRKNVVTKITVVGYGLLAVTVAFLTNGLGINVLQASLTFSGVTMGPGLGLFLVGALFPFVNTAGALTGCATSLGLSLWIIGGNFFYRPGRYTRLATSSHNCSLNHTVLATPSTTFSPFTFSPGYVSGDRLMHNTSSWLSDPDVEITPLTPAAAGVPDYNGVHKLYAISFLWYTALGATVTIVVGVVASLVVRRFTPRSKKEIPDPSLVLPLAEYLCCCLPKKWRHKLSWSYHTAEKGLQEYTLTALKEDQAVEVGGEVKGRPDFDNNV